MFRFSCFKRWKQKQVEENNAQGLRYLYGIGAKKDTEKAIKFLRVAANQGHPGAQTELGMCYLHGGEVEKDVEEAVSFFRLAANQGHPAARAELGKCYLRGKGVGKDEKEAVRLLRLASDQNCAEAQCVLGYCHEHGKGVAKNRWEAEKLYSLSANQGNESAKVLLATMLKKTEKILKLAAEQKGARGRVHYQRNNRNNIGKSYVNTLKSHIEEVIEQPSNKARQL
jgi:TPR repeat protein